MKYYIIRQISTGYVLPQIKSTRSATKTLFSDRQPPRLFSRANDARSCLTWWLKGETKVKRTGGGGMWDDYNEEWVTIPIKDRKASDYEIVSAELTIEAPAPRASQSAVEV